MQLKSSKASPCAMKLWFELTLAKARVLHQAGIAASVGHIIQVINKHCITINNITGRQFMVAYLYDR